ncbi:MAG: hypothetical protein ACREXU_05105, partial [Gammaproteobacteria bacterium]
QSIPGIPVLGAHTGSTERAMAGARRAHNKRNVAEYEGDVDIDLELLDALLRVAREVYRRASTLDSIKG